MFVALHIRSVYVPSMSSSLYNVYRVTLSSGAVYRGEGEGERESERESEREVERERQRKKNREGEEKTQTKREQI